MKAPRQLAVLAAAGLALAAWSWADDDTRRRIAALDASKYDSDAVIVLDETDVTVRDDGIGTARSRRVTKILKEGAIRGQAVQRFSFDPSTNHMRVEAVRVYRADGTLEQVPLESARIQPSPQWGIFWPNDQILIATPLLEVGDTIETISVKTGYNVAYLASGGSGASAASGGADITQLTPPMPGHWYDEVEFWTGTPIVEKRYTVRIPRDKPLQFEVYNGELQTSVTFDGDHLVYSFTKSDIRPYKRERSMASARDTQCKLVLATLENWEKKARWFYEMNEHAFEVDDDIRAKVAEVIADCRTDAEKITALNHWVAENIRYVGTSRGPCEGFTTHDAKETFRDRGGVCKDKAGLLVAMLRVAGFDAYIVMTQAGTDVAPIPADQFNHAVACVRHRDPGGPVSDRSVPHGGPVSDRSVSHGGPVSDRSVPHGGPVSDRSGDGSLQLLDPTWMPKSRENWSSAEQLQYVVYGLPEGAPLSVSPYSGPEENAASYQARSVLTGDGRVTSELTFTAVGAPETALRRALAGRHPGDRPALFDDWLSFLSPDTRVARLHAMDAVDFSGPITVEATIESRGVVLGDADRRYIRLPLLHRPLEDVIAGDIGRASGPKERTWPMRLRSTRRIELRETLELPAGWTIAELPKERKLDGPAAGLRFSASRSGRQISYECVLDVKHRTIQPRDYANFREVVEAFDTLCDEYLTIQVDAAEAASARRQ